MAGTAREQIAAQIQANHPTWGVVAYPKVPTNVTAGKTQVSLWRSDLKPGDDELHLRHDVVINLYGAKTAGDGVENELDDALDQLMLSLQRIAGLQFDGAERMAFNDTIAGYQVKAYVLSENVYRNTINTTG